MPRTVLVTGAGGFLGAHIVEQLLRDPEIHVVGTVRSVKDPAKNAHLLAMPGARERLRLVEADLTAPGSFDEPMRGVDVCMHVASPYIIDVHDAQRDLVEPAVAGTTSVLEACLKAGTVKQVILTSSTAAIADRTRAPLARLAPHSAGAPRARPHRATAARSQVHREGLEHDVQPDAQSVLLLQDAR